MGLHERINASRVLGYVSGIVANSGRSPSFGYILGLGAGICYGAWSVITKTAITNHDIPPLLFATSTFALGTLMFAPVLAYSVRRAVKSSRAALGLFALSGLSSGTAIIALSFGLEKGDVTVVSPIIAVSPLITLVLVRLFLERLEKINTTLVMGSLLVVGGTVMVVVGDSAF